LTVTVTREVPDLVSTAVVMVLPLYLTPFASMVVEAMG
jgi:hypothetical protein